MPEDTSNSFPVDLVPEIVGGAPGFGGPETPRVEALYRTTVDWVFDAVTFTRANDPISNSVKYRTWLVASRIS